MRHKTFFTINGWWVTHTHKMAQ